MSVAWRRLAATPQFLFDILLCFSSIKINVRNAPTLVYNTVPIEVSNPPGQPIRVAARQRSKKEAKSARRTKRKTSFVSPLFDDRGFPHPQDEWENMLPGVKAGRLIRKRLHDPPKLLDVDPAFGVEFDEKLHGKMLKEELDIAHLTTFQQSVLTAVIKKY